MTRPEVDSGRIVTREAAGALFVVLVGSALHFAFGWVDGWRPMALVAAVNESIWEHLKLAFWPGVAWTLGERLASPGKTGDIWPVKGVSLLVTAALIVGIFTGYTAILGENLLVLDIGTFVVAVAAGQALAAWMRIRSAMTRSLAWTGRVLLVLQLAAYALFTYFPPDFWLFVESATGLSGIPTP